MTKDKKLEELKQRVRSAQELLSEANREVRQYILDKNKKKYNIDIGSIVTREGCDYKVIWITSKGIDIKPWIICLKKKNNGEYGKREYSLYGRWEIKQ